MLHPKIDDSREQFLQLQRTLREVSGLDLSAYKEKQTLRRLTGFLARRGLADFHELAAKIRTDKELRRELTDFLAINVTEFFRNPERFDHLATTVLPALKSRWDKLRLWSAGCSTGAEPYSLAMLLEEMDAGGASRHKVLGTDIDHEALEEARRAVYVEERLREVSAERRRRFFTQQPDGLWQVQPHIRRYVKWDVHNLLADPYPSDQHLILCRNVVIYFTEEAKDKIFARFAESLVPGGYLLLGSTETIFNAQKYGLRSAAPFLYERVEE